MTGATCLKEKGTKYFKDSKYNLALKLYTRGAELVNDSAIPTEKLTEEARSIRVSLHLNLAIVHLKLSKYTLAIKACQDVSLISVSYYMMLSTVLLCALRFLGTMDRI